MSGAYYNERDPYAAQWLRNLIAAGHIAAGEVDQRSITEVSPDELRGFTQCHFFAGIGVWSHALRRAGWGDERPVWTGSCPCQPFSAAGKQAGFDDERHLWPAWFRLIAECRPAIVLGEQVASALDWLDLVSADLEGTGYAFAASDLCAAGFGGAHIRQRLYFVGLADTDGRFAGQAGAVQPGWQHRQQQQANGRTGIVAHAGGEGRQQVGSHPGGRGEGSGAQGLDERPGDGSAVLGMAHADRAGRRQAGRDLAGDLQAHGAGPGNRLGDAGSDGGLADLSSERWHGGEDTSGPHGRNGAQDGSGVGERPHAPLLGRHAVDWLFCRDGKWRPVGPGTFPLADAAPARVGRLRAYGNALDAETASEFCGAVAETLQDLEMRAAA